MLVISVTYTILLARADHMAQPLPQGGREVQFYFVTEREPEHSLDSMEDDHRVSATSLVL